MSAISTAPAPTRFARSIALLGSTSAKTRSTIGRVSVIARACTEPMRPHPMMAISLFMAEVKFPLFVIYSEPGGQRMAEHEFCVGNRRRCRSDFLAPHLRDFLERQGLKELSDP